MELWAGSSCEPKSGNSPQEPSSHSQTLRSLFTTLSSRSSGEGGPGKGREIGAEVGGGRPAAHCLPHPCWSLMLVISPIPSGHPPTLGVWSSILPRDVGPILNPRPPPTPSILLGSLWLSREHTVPHPPWLTLGSLCFAALASAVCTALLSRAKPRRPLEV